MDLIFQSNSSLFSPTFCEYLHSMVNEHIFSSRLCNPTPMWLLDCCGFFMLLLCPKNNMVTTSSDFNCRQNGDDKTARGRRTPEGDASALVSLCVPKVCFLSSRYEQRNTIFFICPFKNFSTKQHFPIFFSQSNSTSEITIKQFLNWLDCHGTPYINISLTFLTFSNISQNFTFLSTTINKTLSFKIPNFFIILDSFQMTTIPIEIHISSFFKLLTHFHNFQNKFKKKL